MEAVISGLGFTPTQYKLMKRLQDGKLHSREELALMLDVDGLYNVKVLNVHFTYIRRILRKRGQTVVYHNGGYQWMRNIVPGE